MAYAYSFNAIDFNNSGFKSIEEALKAAKEDVAGYSENKPKKCFIGEQIEFQPEIDVEDIIGQLQDNADDFGGEYAGDYLKNVTDTEAKQLGEALQKVFDEWEEKTKNKATFFQIDDYKEYSLEAANE